MCYQYDYRNIKRDLRNWDYNILFIRMPSNKFIELGGDSQKNEFVNNISNAYNIVDDNIKIILYTVDKNNNPVLFGEKSICAFLYKYPNDLNNIRWSVDFPSLENDPSELLHV